MVSGLHSKRAKEETLFLSMRGAAKHCGSLFQSTTSMLRKHKVGEIRGDSREGPELEFILKDEEELAEENRSAQPYSGMEVLGSTSDLRGERRSRKRTVPTCVWLLRT